MSGEERVKLTSEEKRKKYLPAIPELSEETILTIEGDDDSDDEPPPPKEKGFLKLPSKLGGKLGGGPKRSFRSEEEVIMESHQDGEVEEVIKQAANKDDLTLNCYKFDTFPDALFSCGGLVTLTAHLNGLKEISPRIDHLQMLVSLNLGQNDLLTLPPEIGDLSSLQQLDVNRNKLTSLPDTLSKLKHLQSINLDYNNLPCIPTCLAKIENLQRCYFIENERIQTFPEVEALANWKNCKLAVDNCPSLKEAWNQVYEKLPGIQLMWNKVYPDQVLDHVFLGSVRTAQSAKVFKQLEITRIVTAGKQLEVIDPIPEGVHQLILNVEDIPEQGLVQVFDEVVEYIEKARKDKARVLVHCFAGLSRSVTFTCAYLMKIYGMTFKESIVMIKKVRPNVNPNTGFRKQLIQYEVDLHGTRLDPADKENDMNSVE